VENTCLAVSEDVYCVKNKQRGRGLELAPGVFRNRFASAYVKQGCSNDRSCLWRVYKLLHAL